MKEEKSREEIHDHRECDCDKCAYELATMPIRKKVISNPPKIQNMKETATEIIITKKGEKRLKEIKDNLKIVLDFVERWNKQDKEPGVAKAARFLEKILDL